jgi:predicted AAA+ superfamily ATPase
MINREFWINRINQAWKKRSLIWLSGVRRAGKTVICQSLSDVVYFDCELPRTRRMLEEPEAFLGSISNKKLVIDEVHRLDNPSEILKIAVDHFPHIKIIATGSSTLAASKKFKDTLTGRKIKIWLTPMLYEESKLFGNADIMHRLLHGGLPPFFCETQLPEYAFQEWLDDYWAKDIQELFRITNKYSFQRFTEFNSCQ